MAILEVLFLIKLLHFINAAADCSISACSVNEVSVRFPFHLEGQQPRNCGYPGFNLSCNNQSMTVLGLPHSGDFLVRAINYLTQQIQLYDSDNCLPKRLLQLNLSSSPFAAVFHQNYTFLSCPTQLVKYRFAIIECLSNSTVSVLATSSTSLVKAMSSSCDVISALPIPVSWPVQYNEGFSSELSGDLLLTWFSPDCEKCESQGGTCGFHGNASQEIGCSYNSKRGKPASNLRVFGILILSIGIPVLVCASGMAMSAYLMLWHPRGNQGNNTQRNPATATVSPQPTILGMGLDESTIESFDKLVLGESKRLPGPNGSTCAICLSEYNSKDTLRIIPECKHCFHADCIDEWLRMNNTCPVCRKSPSPAHNFPFTYTPSMARTKTQAARKRSRSQRQSEAAPSTPRTPTSLRTRSKANAQQGPSTQTQRKKHRFRPGTVALREIRKYQKTWTSLIPAASFIRCVRMITQEFSQEVNRWTAEALVAIQEAAEDFLVHLFEDGMLCAIHAKRITLSE
ncbi:unnamed protein product [Dovyalis caffra]|uniref:RING-type domain-containing protein n=1 Tax=Dovyalis caffra TaxID=77055 RepID=A0AAV1SEA7_9ROSI|nr:unnamed protein product [Dovyalis caffra]